MGPTSLKRSPSHIVVLLGLHHVDRIEAGSSEAPGVASTLKKTNHDICKVYLPVARQAAV